MRVYVAGRVTGLPREQAEKNFKRGCELVREMGHTAVNPMQLVCEGASHREAMAKLIPELMKCDAIYMLNDWQFSEGAMIEEMIAKYAGLKILYF